jgi:hypothetical protein
MSILISFRAFNTLMTEAELGITPRKLPRLGLRFGLVNSRGESLRSNEGLPKAKSRKLGKRVATFNNGDLIFSAEFNIVKFLKLKLVQN